MKWWIWNAICSYNFSDIQDYIKYAIKKHETLTTILPIYVYIDKIINRSTFKITDRHTVEVKTPETMKLIDSTKKVIIWHCLLKRRNDALFKLSNMTRRKKYVKRLSIIIICKKT